MPATTYTVKAYKQMQTYDGVAFTCNLYKNGKKVAAIQNGGNGGPTDVRWDDYTTASTERAAMIQWVNGNFADHELASYGGITEETAADILVDVAEMDRLAKKNVVLSMNNPDPKKYEMRDVRTVPLKDPAHRDVMIRMIAAKYPNALAWNIGVHNWVPVADV